MGVGNLNGNDKLFEYNLKLNACISYNFYKIVLRTS